jgi:hypothetical protein
VYRRGHISSRRVPTRFLAIRLLMRPAMTPRFKGRSVLVQPSQQKEIGAGNNLLHVHVCLQSLNFGNLRSVGRNGLGKLPKIPFHGKRGSRFERIPERSDPKSISCSLIDSGFWVLLG